MSRPTSSTGTDTPAQLIGDASGNELAVWKSDDALVARRHAKGVAPWGSLETIDVADNQAYNPALRSMPTRGTASFRATGDRHARALGIARERDRFFSPRQNSFGDHFAARPGGEPHRHGDRRLARDHLPHGLRELAHRRLRVVGSRAAERRGRLEFRSRGGHRRQRPRCRGLGARFVGVGPSLRRSLLGGGLRRRERC